MDQTEFLRIVTEILEVDAGSVALDDRLDDLGWDSLSNISFIAEVDTVAGVTVGADELAEAVTVADLHRLVQDAVGS